jgi:hypothetical protein
VQFHNETITVLFADPNRGVSAVLGVVIIDLKLRSPDLKSFTKTRRDYEKSRSTRFEREFVGKGCRLKKYEYTIVLKKWHRTTNLPLLLRLTTTLETNLTSFWLVSCSVEGVIESIDHGKILFRIMTIFGENVCLCKMYVHHSECCMNVQEKKGGGDGGLLLMRDVNNV